MTKKIKYLWLLVFGAVLLTLTVVLENFIPINEGALGFVKGAGAGIVIVSLLYFIKNQAKKNTLKNK
jgi:hypothetical protein